MINSSIAFQQLVVKNLPFSRQNWKYDLCLRKASDGQRGLMSASLSASKACRCHYSTITTITTITQHLLTMTKTVRKLRSEARARGARDDRKAKSREHAANALRKSPGIAFRALATSFGLSAGIANCCEVLKSRATQRFARQRTTFRVFTAYSLLIYKELREKGLSKGLKHEFVC